MTTVTFTVYGLPAAQGSKRHVGRGIMVESSKNLKPWREAVKHAALDAGGYLGICPLELTVTFYFPRPKSHYRSGKHAGVLKADAPRFKGSMPDLSKLIRATEDAITDSGLWKDDALVAQVRATKEYSGDFMGAVVSISEIGED
jgi:crossover junction endodeoxyribonuclease RusA